MINEYFIEQLEGYTQEALKEKSRDLIETYGRNPKVFAELLVRLKFFQVLESQEDMDAHNVAVKYLYDMGIFESDNPLDVSMALLDIAKVPSAYLAENEYGGE